MEPPLKVVNTLGAGAKPVLEVDGIHDLQGNDLLVQGEEVGIATHQYRGGRTPALTPAQQILQQTIAVDRLQPERRRRSPRPR